MQRANAAKTAWTMILAGLVVSVAFAAGGRQVTPPVPQEALRAIAVAVDPLGNVLIIESGRIRKLTPAGALQTVSGDGRQGYRGDGGPATEAGYEHPDDVAVDAKGTVYIADNLGHRVRAIAPDGQIRTFAGTGEPGYSGDSGPATAAKFQSPVRLAVDAAGNLYVADSGNARIRKVNAAGVVTTVAGIGRPGFTGDQGPATSAQIGQVSGLAVDKAGNIYFADSDNARIRKITAGTGVISTVAGNGVEGSAGDGGPAIRAAVQPFNLSVDAAGNLFVVEVNRIRKIGTDGVIRTVVGSGSPGFSGDGGPAATALLRGPASVTVDAKGTLFIADALNGRIRKVAADGMISTIAGSSPPSFAAPPDPVTSVAVARGRGVAAPGLLVGAAVPTPPPAVAASGRPALLETRLGMIPRPPLTTVKDCGHVAKTPAQTVVPCIEEALKAKSPFIASFEQAAGGAQTVIGLGGTAPDGVVQVTFDGPAAGATGARVSAAKDCKEPKLTIAAAGSVQVACQ